MKLWTKIKSWFSGVTKIVVFLTDKFGEAAIIKDKEESNYKTWWRYIIAFLEDAYLYAEMVENLLKGSAIPTKSVDVQQHFKREEGDAYVPVGGINSRAFKTSFFKNKAENFNKKL